MKKFGEDPDGDKILNEFRAKLKAGEVKYAMLAYVNQKDEMFMYGDAHSFVVIVGNMLMSSLHETLHHEEAEYEARQETGGLDLLQGFMPDDQTRS